jgi:hypothetical protein
MGGFDTGGFGDTGMSFFDTGISLNDSGDTGG